MRDAARTLASYGRNGDNMLVHVSRKELEGIRALTGRDFTRNPDTGLPEAFNFSSLIPIAAGVAGTALGGPLGGAAAAGLAGAGTAAARGASMEQALTQGLVSGVTSYAGGQLLAGVGEAAGAAGQSIPGSFAGDVASGGAAAAGSAPMIPSVATAPAAEIASSVAPVSGLDAAIANQTSQGLASSGLQTGYDPGIQAVGARVPAASQTIGERASAFGTSLSNVANNPGAAATKLGENIANNKFSALIAGGGMLSQAGDMMGGQPAIPGQEPYDANRYPEQFPTNPRRFIAPPAGYRAGAGPEFRYMAKGGLASMRSEDGYTANLMNEAKAALLGEHPRPREALERFRESFGDDALALLRDRLTGGRVRGAGSGMDDLVPGTIEGRQKVRLADGEFVIPAPVVSALGDGSTDHGSRKLQEMVQSVYRQTYKTDQLPKRLKKGTLPYE